MNKQIQTAIEIISKNGKDYTQSVKFWNEVFEKKDLKCFGMFNQTAPIFGLQIFFDVIRPFEEFVQFFLNEAGIKIIYD